MRRRKNDINFSPDINFRRPLDGTSVLKPKFIWGAGALVSFFFSRNIVFGCFFYKFLAHFVKFQNEFTNIDVKHACVLTTEL